MFEEKDTITLDEYKAWLVGLIRGKKGALPDIEDWKKIKEMLDKIEPDKVYVEKETPFNPHPYTPSPYNPPSTPNPWEVEPWKKWVEPMWKDNTSDKYILYDGTYTSSSYDNVLLVNSESNPDQLEMVFKDWIK